MLPGLLLLAALGAAAGEPATLVFPSGGELSGWLSEEDDGILVLERDGGMLQFPASAVAKVRRGPNAEGSYRAREAALKAGDPDGLWRLARFAADNGLPGRARRAAERALALSPDHAEARAFLGYERVFGQWLKGDELRRTQGWVRHEGAWMTVAQRKAILEDQSREDARAERRPAPPPVTRGDLAVVLNRLSIELATRRSEGVTRVVALDGGAFARAQASRARIRFGRRQDDEQGPQPWRPEPFRAGYSVLGIPPR